MASKRATADATCTCTSAPRSVERTGDCADSGRESRVVPRGVAVATAASRCGGRAMPDAVHASLTYSCVILTRSITRDRYSARSPVATDALPIHLSCSNSSAHEIRRSPPLKVPPVGLRSTLRAEKCSMTSVTNSVEKAAVEQYSDRIHVTGDEYDRIHPWNRPKFHQTIVGLAQNAMASVGMDCPRRPAVRPPSSH